MYHKFISGDNMKILFVLLSCLLTFMPIKAHAENENIHARSYVVMEQNTGDLLESKDCNLRRSVASVSKIMTAILALESSDLFKMVEVGDEINQAVGSSLYLEKGTKINIIELVYGLLLRSGNDAAAIIAENVADNTEEFVKMMNDKAQDLGMKNTVFSNPSGLDMYDAGNISTSYDLAILMRYCMQNPTFREISGTKHFKSSVKGNWTNKHKLIQNYEYAIAGKTGFTKKARRTLITSARKDNMELIVVTLDCGADFAFHKGKFEKYFNNYTYIEFLNKGANYILNYEFISDKEWGILVELGKVKLITKMYKINPKNNELSMYLVNEDGSKTFVGKTILSSYAVKQ